MMWDGLKFLDVLSLVMMVIVVIFGSDKMVYKKIYLPNRGNGSRIWKLYESFPRFGCLSKCYETPIDGSVLCVILYMVPLIILQINRTFPTLFQLLGLPDTLLTVCVIITTIGALCYIWTMGQGVVSYIFSIQTMLLYFTVFAICFWGVECDFLWRAFWIIVAFCFVTLMYLSSLKFLKEAVPESLMPLGMYLLLSLECSVVLSAFVEVIMNNAGPQYSWFVTCMDNAIYGLTMASGIGIFLLHKDDVVAEASKDSCTQWKSKFKLLAGYILIFIFGGFFFWLYEQLMDSYVV